MLKRLLGIALLRGGLRSCDLGHCINLFLVFGFISHRLDSIKAFRRIATRYEKSDKCFAAIINLVAAVLWAK
jgi:transposase